MHTTAGRKLDGGADASISSSKGGRQRTPTRQRFERTAGLCLGIFAAVKAYKGQGSTEALERVGSIRSEIRSLRGDPDNEISRLLTLRDTIDQEIAPNIRDDRGTEFMTFFRNHLDAEIYKAMREDLIHEVTEQLGYLEKGGASDSVNFELGAGW